MLRYWPYALIILLIVIGTLGGSYFRRVVVFPKDLSEITIAIVAIFILLFLFIYVFQFAVAPKAAAKFDSGIGWIKLSCFFGGVPSFLFAIVMVWNLKSSQNILAAVNSFVEKNNLTLIMGADSRVPAYQQKDFPFTIISPDGILMSYIDTKYGAATAYVPASGWSESLLVSSTKTSNILYGREITVSGYKILVRGLFSNPEKLSPTWQKLVEVIISDSPSFFDHFSLTSTSNYLIVRASKLEPDDNETWVELLKAAGVVRDAFAKSSR